MFYIVLILVFFVYVAIFWGFDVWFTNLDVGIFLCVCCVIVFGCWHFDCGLGVGEQVLSHWWYLCCWVVDRVRDSDGARRGGCDRLGGYIQLVGYRSRLG